MTLEYPSCKLEIKDILKLIENASSHRKDDEPVSFCIPCHATEIDIYDGFEKPNTFDACIEDTMCAVIDAAFGLQTTWQVAQWLHDTLERYNRLSPCHMCGNISCEHNDCAADIVTDDGAARCSACLANVNPYPNHLHCPGCGRILRTVTNT